MSNKKEMFRLQEVDTGDPVSIFAVDCHEHEFLVWHETEGWQWLPFSQFEPLDGVWQVEAEKDEIEPTSVWPEDPFGHRPFYNNPSATGGYVDSPGSFG